MCLLWEECLDCALDFGHLFICFSLSRSLSPLLPFSLSPFFVCSRVGVAVPVYSGCFAFAAKMSAQYRTNEDPATLD